MNENTISSNLTRIKDATDDIRSTLGTPGAAIEDVASDVANLSIEYNQMASDYNDLIIENNQLRQQIADITPKGTIDITDNGTINVSQYASANVNVSGGSGESDIYKVSSQDALYVLSNVPDGTMGLVVGSEQSQLDDSFSGGTLILQDEVYIPGTIDNTEYLYIDGTINGDMGSLECALSAYNCSVTLRLPNGEKYAYFENQNGTYRLMGETELSTIVFDTVTHITAPEYYQSRMFFLMETNGVQGLYQKETISKIRLGTNLNRTVDFSNTRGNLGICYNLTFEADTIVNENNLMYTRFLNSGWSTPMSPLCRLYIEDNKLKIKNIGKNRLTYCNQNNDGQGGYPSLEAGKTLEILDLSNYGEFAICFWSYGDFNGNTPLSLNVYDGPTGNNILFSVQNIYDKNGIGTTADVNRPYWRQVVVPNPGQNN